MNRHPARITLAAFVLVNTFAHGGAPNKGFFVDEGSKGFLFESNVVHATSGESVRFNQCQREWHTWKGNAFDGDATAARAGLEPAYRALPPHLR